MVQLILLHKQGCPSCINFRPTWELLKAAVRGLEGTENEVKVEFKEIECTANMDAMKRQYGFTTVPTIVRVDGEKAQRFQGSAAERTLEKLLRFAETGASPEHLRGLVLFYASWCKHCKLLQPQWELAEAQMTAAKIPHAKFEESANRNVMEANGVAGFPTIAWFNEDGSKVPYTGERTADALVAFARMQK